MTPHTARKKLGLSGPAMAKVIGVHYQTWHKWEAGSRQPNTGTQTLIDLLVWFKINSKAALDLYVDQKIKERSNGRKKAS